MIMNEDVCSNDWCDFTHEKGYCTCNDESLNEKTMKKSNEFVATCPALVWSAEDVDLNIERLYESEAIDHVNANKLKEMSNEDKLLWLEQILEDCHDEFCQIINERIGDAIYDYCRDNKLNQ